MSEKEIDRRDLVRTSDDLAEKLAELHIASINKGISTDEILDTFARIYLHHLLQKIDIEAKQHLFAGIDTADKIHNSNTLLGLVLSWGIKISRSFLNAVAMEMAKHSNRT